MAEIKIGEQPVYVAVKRIASRSGDQVWNPGDEIDALTMPVLDLLVERGRVRAIELDSNKEVSDDADNDGDGTKPCRD